jgi:hypothetical protein
VSDLGNLAKQLSALEAKLGPITVAVVKASGQTVFLTEELAQALRLGSQQELPLTCPPNSR